MNTPRTNFRVTHSRPLSPSEGYGNTVTITIDTKSHEILENPTTGHRIFTGRSTLVYPSVLLSISLLSSRPLHIFQQLRREQEIQDTPWLSYLATEISTAVIELGFGRNGFVMDVHYEVVYEDVVVRSDIPRDELRAFLLRLVLLGRVTSKGLKMEAEPCSICLDNLVPGRCSNSKRRRGVPTRMTCSHVFHDRCILEWLQRKNTCPLCRTVLYDRSVILNNVD